MSTTEATKRNVADLVRIALSSSVEPFGAYLDETGMLEISPDASREDFIRLGCALRDFDKGSTLYKCIGWGAYWVTADSGKYGERTAILKAVWGEELAEKKIPMLCNYGTIYRRWQAVGLQKGKGFRWHRNNYPDGRTSGTKPAAPIRQVEHLVYEAGMMLYREGTTEAREAFFKACETADQLMHAGDIDRFAEDPE